MSKIFDNPADSVKCIAKFCFYGCLIVAGILFFIGGGRILSAADEYSPLREVLAYTVDDYARGLAKGYDWYVDGYMGKIQCKTAIYIALASLSSIPLYAFGCLVENVKLIKDKIYQTKEQ